MEIDESPINSGIFALVYKGKYNDNDVAIKILKKDINGLEERLLLFNWETK